jgi:hypothetical protein
MTLEPGKLYRINKWFWLLFPTKETAKRARTRPSPYTWEAASWSSWWSKQLNCNVSFLNEEDTIMAVKVSGKQVKVINQEGKSGWIVFPPNEEWTKNAIVESAKGVPD